jgi:hypothetical protein
VRQLFFLLSSIICAINCIYAMEIEYKVKESKTLLSDSKGQKEYGTVFSQFYQVDKKDKEQSFTYNIVHLPKEIRALIFAKLFEVNQEYAAKFSEMSAGIILKCFYAVLEQCPVILGNKTLDVNDLLKMTKEDRCEVFRIGKPSGLLRLYGVDGTVVLPQDYEVLKKYLH